MKKITKDTTERMRLVAGHLRYAAQMHAAQAGYWTLAYAGEKNKLGGKAASFLSMASEANGKAQEAAGLADMVEKEIAL